MERSELTDNLKKFLILKNGSENPRVFRRRTGIAIFVKTRVSKLNIGKWSGKDKDSLPMLVY